METNPYRRRCNAIFYILLLLLAFSSIVPMSPFTHADAVVLQTEIEDSTSMQNEATDHFGVQLQRELHIVLGLTPNFGKMVLSMVILQLIFIIFPVYRWRWLWREEQRHWLPLSLKHKLLHFLKFTSAYFSLTELFRMVTSQKA